MELFVEVMDPFEDLVGNWAHCDGSDPMEHGMTDESKDYRGERTVSDVSSHGSPSSHNNKEVAQLDEAAKREKNSLKCKRFREKRKREATDLKKRNEEIEQEKDILLSKIAELQTELGSLRGGGISNLELENDLLRREIRQYKIFLQSIVKATNRAPEFTPEEKYRLLYSGLCSGIGQSTGLGYTSMMDPTWLEGKPFNVGGFHIKLRYQYLPYGVEREKAKRINLRMEVENVPVPAAIVADTLYKVKNDAKYINEHYRKFFQGDKCVRVVEDISQSQIGDVDTGLLEKKNMHVMRVKSYEETGSDIKEMIYVAANEETEVFPALLIDNSGIPLNAQSQPLKARVIVLSSSVTKVLPALSEGEEHSTSRIVRVTSPLLQSLITFPEPSHQDLTRCIFINSYPLNDPAYRQIWGTHFPFVIDGELDANYKSDMYHHFQELISPVLKQLNIRLP